MHRLKAADIRRVFPAHVSNTDDPNFIPFRQDLVNIKYRYGSNPTTCTPDLCVLRPTPGRCESKELIASTRIMKAFAAATSSFAM